MIYQSTQQAHPWKATARTFLAVVIPLAALIPALADAITYQDAGLGGRALGGVVVIATAITRAIAVPEVDRFLAKIGLGSAPKAEMDTCPTTGCAKALDTWPDAPLGTET